MMEKDSRVSKNTPCVLTGKRAAKTVDGEPVKSAAVVEDANLRLPEVPVEPKIERK